MLLANDFSLSTLLAWFISVAVATEGNLTRAAKQLVVAAGCKFEDQESRIPPRLTLFARTARGLTIIEDVSTGGYADVGHRRPAPKCVAQSQSTAGNASDRTTNEKRAVSFSLRHKPIYLRNCARLSVDRDSEDI